MQKNNIFGETKYCEICNKILPPQLSDGLCPACKEYSLFQTAKDFIRSGDYNEYDVAQFLNIPLQQVRRWIREGRIQYKDAALNNITLHCQICGTQIAFGTLCPSCSKAQNVSSNVNNLAATSLGNMHHLQIVPKNFSTKKKES